MNAQSDSQLLRAYTERRCEVAFAELVRRHIDLVHSAAIRMVNDPHLAKDVAQGVFVALAKDAAKLAAHPVLSGWLHRTTRNIAAQTVRTEVRRRNREKQVAAMNESPESDTVWEEIAPHLDAALVDLSEPDRDAVLLRYFENKPAQEMATILGITAEAAQKRVSRAVERLRENFAKRGLTAGAVGLASAISANAVQAAPAGLAATISSASIAGTMATAKILTMTLIQKSIFPLVAVVAGCVWLTDLSSAEARLGSRIAALRKHLAAAGAGSSAQKSRTAAKPANDRKEWMKLARKISLLQAREAYDRQTGLELQRRLDAMSAAEILAMMDDMTTWDLPYSGFSTMLQSGLLGAAVEKNPQLVLRHFERRLADWDTGLSMPYQFQKAFAKWATSDSAGATAWLDEMISSGKLVCQSTGLRTNEQCRNQMMADLSCVVIAGLLKSAPDQALARFKSLARDQQTALLQYNYRFQKLEPGAEAGLVKLVRKGMTEDQTNIAAGKHGPYRAMAYEMTHEGGFAKVGAFLDDIQATTEERRIFAEVAASAGLYRLKEESGNLDRTVVDKMRAWLATQAPQNVDRITGKALQGLSDDSGFENTARIIETLYRETGSEELLVSFLDGADGQKSAPQRAEMASWITDDVQRERILLKIQPDLEVSK